MVKIHHYTQRSKIALFPAQTFQELAVPCDISGFWHYRVFGTSVSVSIKRSKKFSQNDGVILTVFISESFSLFLQISE